MYAHELMLMLVMQEKILIQMIKDSSHFLLCLVIFVWSVHEMNEF